MHELWIGEVGWERISRSKWLLREGHQGHDILLRLPAELWTCVELQLKRLRLLSLEDGESDVSVEIVQ